MCQGRHYPSLIFNHDKRQFVLRLAGLILILPGCMQQSEGTFSELNSENREQIVNMPQVLQPEPLVPQVIPSAPDLESEPLVPQVIPSVPDPEPEPLAPQDMPSETIPDLLELNTAPLILSDPITAINVNQPYFYSILGFDPDGDPLTWSLERAVNGLNIDVTNGILFGFNLTLGVHSIVVNVEDNRGGIGEQRYTLTVNENPTIQSIAPGFTFNSYTYRYQILAISPNNLDMSYSLEIFPPGMEIESNSGLLRWKVPIIGKHDVLIKVSDVAGNSAIQSFNLSVLDESYLHIVSNPITIAYEGHPYRHQLTVLSQTEKDKFFTLIESVSGMLLDASTGLITWTPETAGTYTIGVSVHDTDNRIGKQTFEILVLSLEEIDSGIRETLNNIFNKLIAGDIKSARSFMSGEAQANYLPVLNALLPHMEEITANLDKMERLSIDNSSAEYIIPRTLNDETRLFIVTFVADSEGNWKLNSL